MIDVLAPLTERTEPIPLGEFNGHEWAQVFDYAYKRMPPRLDPKDAADVAVIVADLVMEKTR